MIKNLFWNEPPQPPGAKHRGQQGNKSGSNIIKQTAESDLLIFKDASVISGEGLGIIGQEEEYRRSDGKQESQNMEQALIVPVIQKMTQDSSEQKTEGDI